MAGKRRRHRKHKQSSAVYRPLRLRRLALELLEDRRLLAGPYPGIGGTATFVQGPTIGSFDVNSSALGDLDGDEDLDAVVVSGPFGHVWKNNGQATFSAGWNGNLALSSGRDSARTLRVELADLNGDGDLDLFASNSLANTVWFNDGAGNFSDSGQRLGSTFSQGLGLGDLDGDGDIDALVGYSTGASRVWINNGAGLFLGAGSLSGDGARGIALGDVDKDGDLDAVLAYANAVSRTWLNNGAGIFTGSQSFDVVGNHDVALADLDNDGDLDAYFARSMAAPNQYWQNNGNGQFFAAGPAATLQDTDNRVGFADLDGDADLDLFRSAPGEHVLQNNNGVFSPRGQSIAEVLRTFGLGDLDGDGDIDAFVSSFNRTNVWFNTDAEISVAISGSPPEASIPFGSPLTYTITVTNTVGSMVSGAVVTAHLLGIAESFEVTGITRTGGATSTAVAGPRANLVDTVELPVGSSIVYSVTAITADAGDANLALESFVGISASIAPPSDVLVLQNRTHANRQQVVTLGEDSSGDTLHDSGRRLAFGNTRDNALGDLDGDGDLDAFITQGRNNQVWLGDGLGHFSDSGQRLNSEPPAPFGDRSDGQVVLGDVDGDGDLDAVVNTWDRIRLWLNNGAAAFSESTERFDAPGSGNDGGSEVALGDVDGDGDLDIVSLDYSSTGRVWLNNGPGSFSQFRVVDVGRVHSFALADIDGDTDRDIVHSEGVRFNNGSGVFTYNGGFGWDADSIALGDLDGDGDLDLAAGSSGGGWRVWVNDGNAKFALNGQVLGRSGIFSRSLALLDVDGDGDLDVYQVNSGSSDILWLNNGSGMFADSGRVFEIADGVSAAAGDVDGDNDQDLLVATSTGFDYLLLNLAPNELTDVAVTKSSLPTSVAQGQAIEYTIQVSNTSSTGVIGASFSELIPETLQNAELVSIALAGGASTTAVPGPILDELVDTVNLPAGSSVSYTIRARVTAAGSPQASAQQTITTAARIVISDGLFDADLTDNLAHQSFVVTQVATAGTATFKEIFSAPNSLDPNINPHDVALGDLNGDGYLDAVIARAGDELVWLNNGDGSFNVDWQLLAAGLYTTGVALGDVDEDGDLDALFANRDDPSQVWLNDGTGRLVDSGQRLGVNTDVHDFAFGDLDGDGDLDAFMMSSRSDQSRAWINDGAGNFSDSGPTLLGGSTDGSLGDFDGDGDLDVVTSGGLLVNDGHARFTRRETGFTGTSYHGGILGGDIDGDRDLDVVIVRNGPDQVWKNDGRGNFTNTGQSLGNYNARDAVIGDLDGDGDLDFIEATSEFDFDDRGHHVWLNNGSGVFALAPNSFGADQTTLVVLGDLDNDGRLDVIEFNGGFMARDRVWLNADVDLAIRVVEQEPAAAITEGDAARYTVTVTNNSPIPVVGARARLRLSSGLMNGQLLSITQSAGAQSMLTTGAIAHGVTDTLTLPAGGQVIYQISAIVRGPLQENAAPTLDVALAGDITAPEGILDGDASNDQAAENNLVVQATTQGTGVLQPSSQAFPAFATLDVALGDLDGDGDLDAFVTNIFNENRIWLNTGNGQFVQGHVFPFAMSNSNSVALGDMDGDGDLDALVPYNGGGFSRLAVWINNGQGNFSAPTAPYVAFGNYDDIALGDVDGDGDLDAITSGFDVGRVLWINDGTGGLTRSLQEVGGGHTVAFGDVDNDGDLDVVTGRSVKLNDGRGTFFRTSQTLANSFDLELADFDHDGDLDIFSAIFQDANRVLLNDGSGFFVDSGQALGGTKESTSVALADMDNDGDIDAVVTNNHEGDEIWLNDGAAHFSNSGQVFTNVGSQAVAIGDLDADGDLDAFFANGGHLHQFSRVWFNQSGESFTDLVVTTTSGRTQVEQGGATHYTTTITNAGPVAVVGAVLVNAFSKNLTNVVLATYSSSGGASAVVPVGPLSNNRAELMVNLPVGASMTFEFTAMVAAAGSPHAATYSQATSTAIVTLPEGIQERIPIDNESSDNDAIVLAASGGFANFRLTSQRLGQLRSLDVALGDLDGDGDLDAVIINERNVPHRIWENDGQGNYVDSGQELLNNNGEGVSLGDLDNDGDLDIVVHDGSWLMTWRNDGGGNFQLWQRTFRSGDFGDLAVVDLNRDGYLDVFLSGRDRNIWFNDGTGQLVEQPQQFRDDIYRLTIGDVDADGDLDAFLLINSWELWINDGYGTFTQDSVVMRGGSSIFSGFFSRLGDLDSDGDLDLFLGGGVFHNDGQGNFAAGQILDASDSGKMRLGDFDNDGDLDALTTDFSADPAYLWLNDGEGHFIRSDQPLGTNTIAGVEIGDLDNDGDLDFFTVSAGNQGGRVWLNVDTASMGDFDRNGTVDQSDYNVWRSQYGLTGAGLASDANGDGRVDVADYVVWRKNYSPAAAAAVASGESASAVAPERTVQTSPREQDGGAPLFNAPPIDAASFRSRPAPRTGFERAIDTAFSRPNLNHLLVSFAASNASGEDPARDNAHFVDKVIEDLTLERYAVSPHRHFNGIHLPHFGIT